MGRLQSSVGLVTGTNIQSTVDQLIAISGQPRDRLVARTELLASRQQSLSELTALVIGVQISGTRLGNSSIFQSKQSESSNNQSLSATAGNNAQAATHVVRTLQNATTHEVRSLQRFQATDEALGFSGQIAVKPSGGFLDDSVSLTELNDGRGVERGTIRITDRSGKSAEINLDTARTIDDVITAINDADIQVKATTEGNSLKLIDQTGSVQSNLKVEQLGSAETAADLGLWGIDDAADSVTGIELDLPSGTAALRGAALSELNGGHGIGELTNLEITLSDGSTASVDLSAATSTSEIIDAIDASGLKIIARLNDARTGFQIRDVSGGDGTFTITSADDTATELGLQAETTSDIVVGESLHRQSITNDTLLTDLNRGEGVGVGSFTIADSKGKVAAVNLQSSGIETVGQLISNINSLNLGVTASLGENGDGITIVDTAGGSGTLSIADSSSSTLAKSLGIAGKATEQTVGGSLVSALVGTQADVITVTESDTLGSIVEKLNANGRYAQASIQSNDDGTYSLRMRANKGGETGKLAVETNGFDLRLRTESRGQDALIGVQTDGATEQFLTSSDGVFELNGTRSGTQINASTSLSELNGGRGIDLGSFKITDSAGAVSAINLRAQQITTVGGLIGAFNELGIGVSASISEDGTGISIVDTVNGDGKLVIEDVGNGKSAANLGIAGTAKTQTIGGAEVSALVGTSGDATDSSSGGLVLTVKELSDDPITVKITDNPEAVTKAAQTFVDQYNKLVEKLDSLTFYNAETQEVGLLFGSSEALRIRNSYAELLTGTISQAGDIKSLGQVGMRLDDKGKLQLDSEKMTSAFEQNPIAVDAFFSTSDTGLSARLNTVADRIAGVGNSMLLGRSDTLGLQIQRNNERIDQLNLRLESERERLLKNFYKTEEAIAKIQTNSSFISQIQPVSFPES